MTNLENKSSQPGARGRSYRDPAANRLCNKNVLQDEVGEPQEIRPNHRPEATSGDPAGKHLDLQVCQNEPARNNFARPRPAQSPEQQSSSRHVTVPSGSSHLPRDHVPATGSVADAGRDNGDKNDDTSNTQAHTNEHGRSGIETFGRDNTVRQHTADESAEDLVTETLSQQIEGDTSKGVSIPEAVLVGYCSHRLGFHESNPISTFEVGANMCTKYLRQEASADHLAKKLRAPTLRSWDYMTQSTGVSSNAENTII